MTRSNMLGVLDAINCNDSSEHFHELLAVLTDYELKIIGEYIDHKKACENIYNFVRAWKE